MYEILKILKNKNVIYFIPSVRQSKIYMQELIDTARENNLQIDVIDEGYAFLDNNFIRFIPHQLENKFKRGFKNTEYIYDEYARKLHYQLVKLMHIGKKINVKISNKIKKEILKILSQLLDIQSKICYNFT